MNKNKNKPETFWPNSDVSATADRAAGNKKIEWAWAHMPILRQKAKELAKSQLLAGISIAVSVHVEAKTACLALALAGGGAQLVLTGCNPLSTQDDVAAALAARGVTVCARHDIDDQTYWQQLETALSIHPHIVIDDGGDFAQLLHTTCSGYADRLIGGCEETTTGVSRLRSLEKNKKLAYPVIAVNDARSKHLFDNRFGTGQSVWTAIMAITNLLVAGKTVVVAGYGLCGKGVALRAKGLGARVIVTEIDPVKACEALLEGFDVLPMGEAAALGDIFVTVTGCNDVITTEHFKQMKSGAIMCNAGHFDVEINLTELNNLSVKQTDVRPHIKSFELADGRLLYLLAAGRLVNLAAYDGHPVEIMDMSFSLQLAAVLHLIEHGRSLSCKVYPVPPADDLVVAAGFLQSWNKSIDVLSAQQAAYLREWEP